MTSPNTTYTSKLKDARILIIGGTSGIGYAVAEAVLSQGADVIISSSQSSKLSASLSKLEASFSTAKVTGYPCDLSSPETMESNIINLLKSSTAGGKLDHVVFTAGDSLSNQPLAEATYASIITPGNVRFFSTVLLGKHAAAYMTKSPKSSITLTSGVNTLRPAPGWGLVAAYGAAVEGFARGLAIDLAPVRVNTVSPGAVHTELFGSISPGNMESMLKRFRDWALTGEVGRPDAAAESYVYCMRSDFVDGQVIHCEGGRLVK